MKMMITIALMVMSIGAVAQNKYQVIREGKKYVCRGEEKCRMDDKTTFGSAMLWALDNVRDTKSPNSPVVCNANNMTLDMTCEVEDNVTSDKIYAFQLKITVSESKLAFLVENIKCVPKGVMAVFKTLYFDKLNIEKKPQQIEYINNFSSLCNQFIQKSINEIINKKLNLTHWDDIVNGVIVKGMNVDEVRLTKGNPIAINENAQRTVWTFPLGTVIMFEKGVVSGVIE